MSGQRQGAEGIGGGGRSSILQRRALGRYVRHLSYSPTRSSTVLMTSGEMRKSEA